MAHPAMQLSQRLVDTRATCAANEPAPPSHGRKERRDELARIQTRILEGTRAAAAVAVAEEQDMTRQSKHKHRVTRLMLSVIATRLYDDEIMAVIAEASGGKT